MISTELSLCFKGSRSYVQGTSMLESAMEVIALSAPGIPPKKIDFLINKMTGKSLVFDFWEKGYEAPVNDKTIATCSFSLGDLSHEGRLVESERNVEQRVPYDESAVTDRCVFSLEERVVSLTETPSDVSPIEILVSMTKALHYQVFEIPSDNQWVFCRWESAIWPLPKDLSGVTLTIDRTVGTRLTRAAVVQNNDLVGRIYFSARDPRA